MGAMFICVGVAKKARRGRTEKRGNGGRRRADWQKTEGRKEADSDRLMIIFIHIHTHAHAGLGKRGNHRTIASHSLIVMSGRIFVRRAGGGGCF